MENYEEYEGDTNEGAVDEDDNGEYENSEGDADEEAVDEVDVEKAVEDDDDEEKIKSNCKRGLKEQFF